MSFWSTLFGSKNKDEQVSESAAWLTENRTHLGEALRNTHLLDPEKDAFPPLPKEWNTLSSILFLGFCSALQQEPTDDLLRTVTEVTTITLEPMDFVKENIETYVMPWADQVQNIDKKLIPVAIMEHSAICIGLGERYCEEFLIPCFKHLARSGSVPEINEMPANICTNLVDGYKRRKSSGNSD